MDKFAFEKRFRGKVGLLLLMMLWSSWVVVDDDDVAVVAVVVVDVVVVAVVVTMLWITFVFAIVDLACLTVREIAMTRVLRGNGGRYRSAVRWFRRCRASSRAQSVSTISLSAGFCLTVTNQQFIYDHSNKMKIVVTHLCAGDCAEGWPYGRWVSYPCFRRFLQLLEDSASSCALAAP
eukprot:3455223-Amphidinium_carterae.1